MDYMTCRQDSQIQRPRERGSAGARMDSSYQVALKPPMFLTQQRNGKENEKERILNHQILGSSPSTNFWLPLLLS